MAHIGDAIRSGPPIASATHCKHAIRCHPIRTIRDRYQYSIGLGFAGQCRIYSLGPLASEPHGATEPR